MGRVSYAEGEGLAKDINEAINWYRKAAEQGIVEAQENLGYLYLKGDRVPKDRTEAAKWYRKAAEQGVAIDQNMLGLFYIKGDGIPKNTVEGLAWCILAADSGDVKIVEMRDKRITELGPEVTQAARERSLRLKKEIETAKRR